MNPLDPISRYLMMGKLIALLGAIGLICYQSGQIHKWHGQADHCATARQLDRATYEKAQADAKAKNDAAVAAQEAKSREITKETRDAYQNDLAKLRAADRLRQTRIAAPASPTGKPDASQGPGPTAGADGDGLHLSPSERLQAEEVELRLMHLQNWVRDQINAQ